MSFVENVFTHQSRERGKIKDDIMMDFLTKIVVGFMG